MRCTSFRSETFGIPSCTGYSLWFGNGYGLGMSRFDTVDTLLFVFISRVSNALMIGRLGVHMLRMDIQVREMRRRAWKLIPVVTVSCRVMVCSVMLAVMVSMLRNRIVRVVQMKLRLMPVACI